MSEETIGRNIKTRQRHIYTNSFKAVAARNAKYAEENNTEYKKPSNEQLKSECQRRWELNAERKKQKDLDVSGFFEV
jgi:hypothetical protein